MRALVVDARAVEQLVRRGRFSADWFVGFAEDGVPPGVRRIEQNGFVYLLDPDGQEPRNLIVRLAPDALFSGLDGAQKSEAFARILQAALACFDRRVGVPTSWVPYRSGSLMTFYACRGAIGDGRRVVMERNPLGSGDVLADNLLPAREVLSLTGYRADHDLYLDALDGLNKARERAGADQPGPVRAADALTTDAIELNETFPQYIDQGFGVDDWYDKRLTEEQRTFVDTPLESPLRLRGAAGTGKTLAMVVKALRHLYAAADRDAPLRALFVTHSWSTTELVTRVAHSMDARGLLASGGRQVMDITTLQALATKSLDLNDPDIRPISLDGYEGKLLQMMLVEETLEKFLASDWTLYRDGCSEVFVGYLESEKNTPRRQHTIYNLMNEFSYVIGSERGMSLDRYLALKRPASLMKLEAEADRQSVYTMYVEFKDLLVRERVLGVHQVMGDFLRQMDFNIWQRKRLKEGYDCVFVDEFHLFNQQEVLAFQYLTRNPDPPYPVIMALDPKQSPGEAWFGQVADDGSAPGVKRFVTGLRRAESVTLNRVFRYTRQIAAVIRSINEGWPGIDFDEDNDALEGTTEISEGPPPRLHVVANAEQLYKQAFNMAKQAARSRRAGGPKVAVLCLDAERFERYAQAGQFADDSVVIRSREDAGALGSVGRKFVLSQPEYVAGLQFEVVCLVDANENLLPDGLDSSLEVRRFLSNLYLGASRAQHELHVFASTDAAGLTRHLKPAVASGALAR